MITIIDYGMGNLGSIKNMLKKIGVDSLISNRKDEIVAADKLILPGVGAFDKAMLNLKKLDLIDLLNKKVLDEKVPILGICLGMQLLAKSSAEGKEKGLGWIDGEVLKFNVDKSLKVPHMGWNRVCPKNEDTLFKNMYKEPRFYFVHTYYFKCNNDDEVLSTTDYGGDFVSAVNKENIYGVQFHPEKSHKFGMKLFENFSQL